MITWHIYKLNGHIERDETHFWRKPWVEKLVERDPYLQDYYNTIWHLTVGWLWWSAEICWDKGFHWDEKLIEIRWWRE